MGDDVPQPAKIIAGMIPLLRVLLLLYVKHSESIKVLDAVWTKTKVLAIFFKSNFLEPLNAVKIFSEFLKINGFCLTGFDFEDYEKHPSTKIAKFTFHANFAL